jgi:hypothetical protein
MHLVNMLGEFVALNKSPDFKISSYSANQLEHLQQRQSVVSIFVDPTLASSRTVRSRCASTASSGRRQRPLSGLFRKLSTAMTESSGNKRRSAVIYEEP